MKRRLLLAVGLSALGAVAFLALRPKQVAPPQREVLRADVELRGGILFARGETKPLAALLIDNYDTGARKAALDILNGKANGVSRGWTRDGKLESEEHFLDGISNGLRTRWFPGGQKKSESAVVQGKLEGEHREWYDNGQPALAMTLRGGQSDGVAEAWHRSGAIKSRTRFERGQIADRQFFTDKVADNRIAAP